MVSTHFWCVPLTRLGQHMAEERRVMQPLKSPPPPAPPPAPPPLSGCPTSSQDCVNAPGAIVLHIHRSIRGSRYVAYICLIHVFIYVTCLVSECGEATMRKWSSVIVDHAYLGQSVAPSLTSLPLFSVALEHCCSRREILCKALCLVNQHFRILMS